MGVSECRDLESLLQPYVDGEFQSDDRAELEVHLAHCTACRQRVDQERQFRARIREVAQVQAPAALRSRIDLGIKQERRWARFQTSARGVAVAAAAAFAGFLAYFGLSHSNLLLEPLQDDSVDHHAKNLPMEVLGDEQRIESWFLRKVDFNVNLPHFRNANLQGGRLSHIRDHSAAYVTYGGPHARRVSLFVFDDPHAPYEMGFNSQRRQIANREVVLGNQRGYNVAVWHDNEIVYSLVSDLDERDIVSLLESRMAPSDERIQALPVLPPALGDFGFGMPQVAPASLHSSP